MFFGGVIRVGAHLAPCPSAWRRRIMTIYEAANLVLASIRVLFDILKCRRSK